jgi:hypothetical protein
MRITAIKGEDWIPTVNGAQSNGVFRDLPNRAAPVVARVPAGTVVRTVAEVETNATPPDNRWRLTEHAASPPTCSGRIGCRSCRVEIPLSTPS